MGGVQWVRNEGADSTPSTSRSVGSRVSSIYVVWDE